MTLMAFMRFSSRSLRPRLPALPTVGLLALAASAAVFAPAPAAHAQNLVQNPGFEEAYVATGNFEDWKTTGASSGSIIYRSRLAHTGSAAVAFAAYSRIDDALSQSIATIANQEYTFSFWLQNDGDGSDHFAAYWDNQVIPVFEIRNSTSAFDYTQYVFPVIASGTSTQIRFAGYDGPSSLRLDDVSVTANDPAPPTAVTPEASSLVNLAGALMGPGVLGMVAVRRQKRRKASQTT